MVSSVYLSLQYYLVCSAILGRWCKKEIIPISAFGISRGILGVLLPNGVVFSVILMAIDLLVCIAMIFFKADIKKDNSTDFLTLEYEIHVRAVGYHLSEKEAEVIVDDVGKHWSKEQTDQFRGSHDANDFYAGLNLIYSIFRKDKYSTTDYVELTNAFIEVDDRLIKYYYFIV